MTSPTEMTDRSVHTLIARLLDLYYAGAWVEAEHVCEAILAQDPQRTETFVTWGELALLRGDVATARERLRQATQRPFPIFDLILRLIQLMTRAGDISPLESALPHWLTQLQRNPASFSQLCVLGFASEALGRVENAISAYERAAAVMPANSFPYTYRAMLLLRREWGAPLASPPEKRQRSDTRGRVSMTALGLMGRFGNQIFQYAFARLYGGIHDLRVEVPNWIGRWLFDLDDPYPDTPLRPLDENPAVMGTFLDESSSPLLAGHDLQGYFQCHTRHYRRHQRTFRALFQPGARLKPSVERALARLGERGRTLVAIHLRRGDYSGGRLFWPAPVSWYLDWLGAIWQGLDAPVLYIASDDDTVHRELAAFSPVTAGDLGGTIPGAETYPDFHVLAHADLLAISNSSFSVTAAMLNERGRAFLRPEPNSRKLVPFDPWNTEVLLRAPAPEAQG